MAPRGDGDTRADDVLIVGAGPAGLTAGYMLTRDTDLAVRIVEAHPTLVGGISRTESHLDCLIDIGGHRFFTKSPAVEALWREILPDGFLPRPRLTRIFYRRKFYNYPLSALETLRNLGPWESALCVASYVRARLRPIAPERSFADWVANRFGARLFGMFFKSYTEKVWGMRCEEISADWAAQRIKNLDLWQAAMSGLRRSLGLRARSGPVIKTLVERFNYPQRGPGMMWRAAADKIAARGGTIELGLRATEFSWDAAAGMWSVTVEDRDGLQRLYRARHVISSAPMSELVAAVRPAARTVAQASRLRYRDFMIVALVIDGKPDFPDNWIYVHDPNLRVGRVDNFAVWTDEMAPPGRACLGFEYFSTQGDAMWRMDDEALIALATRELADLGLAGGSRVIGARVIRQLKAYPVYDAAYRDIVAAVRTEFAERFPTLHFVGRNGMHKYNNQDHAMMTAMLTAENIVAGRAKFDVWNVNEDAQYHEEEQTETRSGAGGLRAVPTLLPGE